MKNKASFYNLQFLTFEIFQTRFISLTFEKEVKKINTKSCKLEFDWIPQEKNL